MEFKHEKLVLWTGEKHSGKTTGAGLLVETIRDGGFAVAGLLAEALYENNKLLGFDAVDLLSGAKAPLARRGEGSSFEFLADGIQLGKAALGPESATGAEFLIVDEFGPLEIKHQGWRSCVDSLIRSSKALVAIVVRNELVRQVEFIYANVPTIQIRADEPSSIETVLSILRRRRQANHVVK
ncbi:MAG: DUF2478 domain-containing protein [Sedimentisphaerales bacterium]|nr:DUF2478 domain-containing protein [Sedimentisphaerales bacterium]